MYRPAAYAIDDVAALHAAIRARPFATIAAPIGGAIHFAYAPVVADPRREPLGVLRFHLARANPLAEPDGALLRFSFLGPDAYISPDWYDTKGLVPTWNYVAIEASGRARELGEAELRQLLVDLSARAEQRLHPKAPWTLEKVADERIAAMLRGIRGFEVRVENLQGKFKLSQDKKREDVAGVIAALEAYGDAAGLAVAQAMGEFT